jgi:hypothetical protein
MRYLVIFVSSRVPVKKEAIRSEIFRAAVVEMEGEGSQGKKHLCEARNSKLA